LSKVGYGGKLYRSNVEALTGAKKILCHSNGRSSLVKVLYPLQD